VIVNDFNAHSMSPLVKHTGALALTFISDNEPVTYGSNLLYFAFLSIPPNIHFDILTERLVYIELFGCP